MTEPVTQCIFCGNPDISLLTWEHIWPRRWHRQITKSMRKWNSLHGTYRIEQDRVEVQNSRITQQGGDVHDFQVKCVCGGFVQSTCNAGWMREFEASCDPIMLLLMNGKSTRLSPEQQGILAGWIALKAMVMEYNRTGHVTTTQEERNYLMATKRPPDEGWGIWIGHFERKDWPAYMAATPFAYWPDPEKAHLLGIPTTEFNGQASFQVVKKLYIQVIRCIVPSLVEKWRFDQRATNLLRRIWPPSGYSLVWPPPVMTDHDADYVSNAFPQAAKTAVQRALKRKAKGEPPGGMFEK